MSAAYILIGSSGSGKTTLLRRVVRDFFPDLVYAHFDDFPAPSREEVERNGGTEQWQTYNAYEWIRRTAEANTQLTVLDAQARPSVLQRAASKYALPALHITLLDCGHEERRRRLLQRSPELDQLDTYAWAAYLRGQADALGLEIIDTTSSSLEVNTKELARSIERFARAINTPLNGAA